MKDKVDLIGELQQRLDQLEAGAVPAAGPTKRATAPQLFNPQASKLDASKQAKLKQLAGRGPGRLKDLGASALVPAAEDPTGGTIEEVGEHDAAGGAQSSNSVL